MRKKLKSLWHQWLLTPEERFLNAATDHADLERRQKRVWGYSKW